MPEQNINRDGAVDSFLNELVAAKGISEEQRPAEIERLRGELDAKVNEEMIAALPDDKLVELDEKLDTMSDEELEEFLASSGADFDGAVEQAMRDFAQEYVGAAAAQGRAPGEQSGDVQNAQGDESAQGVAQEGATTNDNSQNTNNTVANGAPMQGAISEAPGSSDVEGATNDGATQGGVAGVQSVGAETAANTVTTEGEK